ncbi:hypothetical protein [Tichowtungia aerotolerans]|uniref:Lipoprotein n=1 Tax=Tichowtungia aerotolerans TaxID=2697043 RepID=A0A6P1M6X4_9BACT|nr:hypothetical protein [Tichowtungia aerotolerans]QHI69601.1 hypothetical protein GT409_09070 [Tichowtungia aerotolerans]
MMKKIIDFLLLSLLLISAGCKTTETQPVSWEQQQAYMGKVRDPRLFGLGIYQTPGGLQIRGGGRLHPSKAEILPMLSKKPWRPVVNMNGTLGKKWPVLLDCTVSASLFEFDTAVKAKACPVGEGGAQLVRWPGDEVPCCVSLIPSIRLGQVYVENQLVMVRMANRSLGESARGAVDPDPCAVLGWDVLEKFEQIQFLYSIGQVLLKTTDPYEPNPLSLSAQIPLVDHRGACVVRGLVNGSAELILIDPAGDFEVAAESGASIDRIKLAEGVVISSPSVASSPGGIRIGAHFLQNYRVTICPRAGVVYFENPEL